MLIPASVAIVLTLLALAPLALLTHVTRLHNQLVSENEKMRAVLVGEYKRGEFNRRPLAF